METNLSPIFYILKSEEPSSKEFNQVNSLGYDSKWISLLKFKYEDNSVLEKNIRDLEEKNGKRFNSIAFNSKKSVNTRKRLSPIFPLTMSLQLEIKPV